MVPRKDLLDPRQLACWIQLDTGLEGLKFLRMPRRLKCSFQLDPGSECRVKVQLEELLFTNMRNNSNNSVIEFLYTKIR